MTIKIPEWMVGIFIILLIVGVLVGIIFTAISLSEPRTIAHYNNWHSVAICVECDNIVPKINYCCPHCGDHPLNYETKIRRMYYDCPWYKTLWEEPVVEWKE